MRESALKTARAPRWYLIPVRILIVTFFVTLLAFALGLLIGICVVLLSASPHPAHPDLRIAYRHIALPIAGIAAVIAAVSATLMELRHYHRAKTLSHIESQMGRAT